MLQLDPVTFSIQTALPNMALENVLQSVHRIAAEYDYTVSPNQRGGLRLETAYGMLDVASVSEQAVLILSSVSRQSLYMLKESVEALLRQKMQKDDLDLQWSGDLMGNVTPPNFCEATVVQSRRVSRIYQRITLSGAGIERFFDGAMHFRLLWPIRPVPAGQVPKWPYLNEHGKTIWPTGEAELMQPVYTVRSVNRLEKTLDFDVFLHEGGPTADWALKTVIGQKVGIMGPSGGWIPSSEFMMLAGDETAIPAICRILETLETGVRGHVLLSIENEGDQIPIALPNGMNVQWLVRNGGPHEVLFDAMHAMPLPENGSVFVWLGAKKSVARLARQHYRQKLGFNSQNSYLAGYWDDVPASAAKAG